MFFDLEGCMENKLKLCFLLALDIIFSIILIPILGKYRGIEVIAWTLSCLYFLLLTFSVYFVIKKMKERKYCIILILSVAVVISSYWLYEPLKSKVVTFGKLHFEIEYHSHDPRHSVMEDNYDWLIKKYNNPVLTTIGELKSECSLDSYKYSVSIEPKKIELGDDTQVWVYASVYNDYNVDDIVFLYDELEPSQVDIKIKTHFKIKKAYGSSAGTCDLVVLSIVPVDQ